MSDDEAELWRRAVRDVKPLALARGFSSPPTFTQKTPAAQPRLIASRQSLRSASPGHFVYGGGDPGLDRRAAAGRLSIDRTLDLHGMTQIEAHRALTSFLNAAIRDGARLALVITGKGRASGLRHGVLKERFLDWIEQPPLRVEIARVAPAKPKDGGGGAFYVFLKHKGAGRSPRL